MDQLFTTYFFNNFFKNTDNTIQRYKIVEFYIGEYSETSQRTSSGQPLALESEYKHVGPAAKCQVMMGSSAIINFFMHHRLH